MPRASHRRSRGISHCRAASRPCEDCNERVTFDALFASSGKSSTSRTFGNHIRGDGRAWEQIQATVRSVAFYHGGDVLYTLDGPPPVPRAVSRHSRVEDPRHSWPEVMTSLRDGV